MELNDLPEEVLERIFSYTSSYEDYLNLSLVNKRFNCIIATLRQFETKTFNECFTNGNIKWIKISTKITPVERHSHSCCRVQNRLYVFGGLSATCTSYNDLWILNLDSYTWHKPLTNGRYPSPKAAASILSSYNEELILYGGYSHPYQYSLAQQVSFFNELHIFCTKTLVWSLKLQSTHESPKLAGHTSSIINNTKMILFGGCENLLTNKTNRVYCLCLETFEWQQRDISGPEPQARYGHSQITLDNDRILIVGGCGGPNTLYDDVWLLNWPLDEHLNPNWTRLSINHSVFAPSQLHCITLVRVKNKLITFGKPKQALNNQRKCTCLISIKQSTKHCSIHSKLMHIFTLDINNIANKLSNELIWIEPIANFTQAPSNKILYSLNTGINELVLFGGMEIESQLQQTQQQNSDGFIRNKVCGSLYLLRAKN